MIIIDNQRGQALSETLIVLSSAGVALALLVPALAAIFDMQNAAHQASRYVAWERTVGRSDAVNGIDMVNEVRDRFYRNPLGGMSGLGVAPNNQLWNAGKADFASDGAIVRYDVGGNAVSDTSDTIDIGSPATTQYTAVKLPNIGATVGWTAEHRDMLNLEERGIDLVNIGLELSTESVFSFAQGAQLSSKGLILSDSWVPASEVNFRATVDGATPFDNESLGITSLVDYVDGYANVQLGEFNGVGPVDQEVPILAAAETVLAHRDGSLSGELFDLVFQETVDAAEGEYNMTAPVQSGLLPPSVEVR